MPSSRLTIPRRIQLTPKEWVVPELITQWINAINAADIDQLTKLMSPNHTFYVDGEAPTVGAAKNTRAWQQYFASYPHYQIIIDSVHKDEDTYYLLGHTNGSHVPDELETIPESVIWKVGLAADTISEWIIYDGDKRVEFGLSADA